jgi:hypothetical protein
MRARNYSMRYRLQRISAGLGGWQETPTLTDYVRVCRPTARWPALS